jgi:hypothetical protein
MKLRSLVGEARRNLAAGVVPFWLVVPVLALLLGLVGSRYVAANRTVLLDADRRRIAGVDDLRVVGDVDGVRCESLASNPRFVSSGAIRRDDPAFLPEMPDIAIEVIELTSGAARSLGLNDAVSGVFLSESLDQELGSPPTLTVGGAVVVRSGSFRPDSTLSQRDRTIVTITSPAGSFQECLVRRISPLDSDAALVLSVTQPSDGVSTQVEQINSKFGIPIDSRARLAPAGGLSGKLAAVVCGLLVGMASSWLRRRDIALLGQLGVSRSSVAAVHGLETIVWAAVPVVVSAVPLALLITNGTTSSQAVYLSCGAAVTSGLGWCACVTGSMVAAASVRPRNVLQYLRDS